jgi:glucosyl-3-phosphoglycerate phosphatase
MSERRLVLVRHGRTPWNVIDRAQGHTDVPLDEVGNEQAEQTAEALALLGPSRLWTSDLARARQTAAYLEKSTGLIAVADERLREFNLGVRAGLTRDEFAARFPEEYDAWVKGDTARIVVLGEETSDEVRGRITSAFWDYFGSLSPGETGIAVTHGGCLRLGVSELLGWSDGQWRSLRVLDNGAWAVLSQTGDMLPRLSAYNLTAADHGFPRRSSDFALE